MRVYNDAVLILPVMFVAATSAWPIDFNGAWATGAAACTKVFEKKATKFRWHLTPSFTAEVSLSKEIELPARFRTAI
jgi:hypothetical protein